MRGGRGNARSRSDSVPSFSFVPFDQPFSASSFFLALLSLPLSLSFSLALLCLSSFHARVARVLSLLGPNSPSPPSSVSRRGSPITAERARSKAPRARSYSRPGVLNIWVIGNANKKRERERKDASASAYEKRVCLPRSTRPIRFTVPLAF